MTTADNLYHQQPVAVEVARRDGTQATIFFATRLEAEAWVALIPLLQVAGEVEAATIASALIRVSYVGVN